MSDKDTDKSIYKNKSAAGKGDSPRNISKQYFENYDLIEWSNKKKNITNRHLPKNT